MDSRAREVVKMGDTLFEKKKTVDSLWQEICLNVYPERADFTDSRNDGEEFADHLFSSYPLLARRELGNLLSAHLRPQGQRWFSIHVEDEELDDNPKVREYLDYLGDVQWRAMYDSRANFVKATKQADHDFAALGNAVVYIRPNADLNGLLYTCYHLRDCAWTENAEGAVDIMHRNWKPSARQLKALFGEAKVSEDVRKACKDDPEKTFNCRHAVLPSRVYDYKSKAGRQFPFVSLYVECEKENVLEEIPISAFPYVVPRWQTISGSPFGRSMATTIALPDSRTMQSVIRTIREAGEKFVDPPLLSAGDLIRGDVAVYAGGITSIDIETDRNLDQVLRPLNQDKGGMPIGFEIATGLREDIRHAFFLDKVQLPEVGKDMTAFEVRRRIQEQIRAQSPIFEPVEQEMNVPYCERTFNLLAEYKTFDTENMPEELSKQKFRYRFNSPLADLADQNDAEIYKEVTATIIAPAAQIDPSILAGYDFVKANRDAARAAGWKAKWFKDEKAIEEARVQLQQQQAQQQQMATAGQVAEIAKSGGAGMKAISDATAPNGR